MTKLSATTLLLVFAVVRAAEAQTPTGVIAGTVADSSAAAISGARVSVTNRDTHQNRAAMTSLEGRYGFDALAPGEYLIAAEYTGFKRLERAATVEAGTTTTVDLALEIGDVSASVTVSIALPLLH